MFESYMWGAEKVRRISNRKRKFSRMWVIKLPFGCFVFHFLPLDGYFSDLEATCL